MRDFTHVQKKSSADVEHMRALYEPLTRSVRALIDATIRTETGADAVSQAIAEIDSATARLASRQIDGSYGIQFVTERTSMPWGNAVVGIRNPVAPPLVVERAAEGSARSDFVLGAAYEGPPGHVHGGVAALVLDHVLGEAASDLTTPGVPRFTGTISLRYLRPTRLGRLRAEAHVDRVEGFKTFAVGQLTDEDGVTVEAQGVFIQPKWARD